MNRGQSFSDRRWIRAELSSPWLRRLLRIVLIAAVYYLAAQLGFLTRLPTQGILLWPPPAVALASFLIWDSWMGVGVFLGALLTHWGGLSGTNAFPVAAGIAAGVTLQAWAGAKLIRRYIQTVPPSTPRYMLVAIGIIALTSTLAPLIRATSLASAGYQDWDQFATLLSSGWFSNVIGILIFTPSLIIWVTRYGYKKVVVEPLLWALTCLIIGLTLIAFWVLRPTAPERMGGNPAAVFHPGQWFSWASLLAGFLLAGLFLTYIYTRQKMEGALHERENEYRLVSENTGDVIWILDVESQRLVYVSPSVQKASGYTPQEVLNKSLEAILTPDSYMGMLRLLPERLNVFNATHADITYTDTLQQIKKDGSILNTETATTFVTNSAGKTQIVGIARDITERLRAALLQETVYHIAEAAHTSESLQDLYAQIHRHISRIMYAENFYIALHDAERNLTQFVYSVDEKDVRSPEPFTPQNGLTSYVLRSGKSLLFSEDRASHGFDVLGTPAQVWLGAPLVVHGQTIGVIAVQHYTDKNAFTEREQRLLEFVSSQVATAIDLKRSEETVRLIERRNNALIEHAPDGIVSIGTDGKCKFASPSACRVFGYRLDEIIGTDPVGKIHPEDVQRVLGALQELLVHPTQTPILQYRFQRSDGSYRWVESTFSNLVTEPGVHAVVINFRDITERKQAEELLRQSQASLETLNRELEQRVEERTAELLQREEALRESRDQLRVANIALEKAARMKDEFLANMSHELRTPLTGILGLTEALQIQLQSSDALTEKQHRALKNIENSGRHLLELINDILDLSKIEAGKLEMQFAPCALGEICQASLQLIRGMAHQKRQQVDFRIDPPDISLFADARRLKQMLVNLLSNAVKFTPENGSFGLDVQAHPEEKIVRLSVWDRGIGIRPENLERIFLPFVQLDSGLARQYSGTGLGLSLVKRMVELHGGSIQVESAPGQGSRFTLTLPWRTEPPDPGTRGSASPLKAGTELKEPAPAEASAPLVTPLILIADDNAITLEMLTDFLESRKYRVVTVQSGAALLERAVELHPDLILTDIQMPDLDGLETLRRLRAHGDPALAATPVIAVTALAMPGDRERCLQAGANEYISKPIALGQLVRQIAALLERT